MQHETTDNLIKIPSSKTEQAEAASVENAENDPRRGYQEKDEDFLIKTFLESRAKIEEKRREAERDADDADNEQNNQTERTLMAGIADRVVSWLSGFGKKKKK